jgi:hypothetical protein
MTSVSDTELSKEIENPLTRRITLLLRYEADFLDGAYKATTNTFSQRYYHAEKSPVLGSILR